VTPVVPKPSPVMPGGTTARDEALAVAGRSPAPSCNICGNVRDNKTHQAKEMMFGWQDSFTYVECGMCGCVVLADPPADLAHFYPESYCSFRANEKGLRGLAKRLRVQSYFGRDFGLGSWIAYRYPRPDLAAMARMVLPKDSRILDVGCGGGKLLLELSTLGYQNLTGTDPFVESNLEFANGVRVKKCFLTDLARSTESSWDVIMFHHSFEHIPDQLETLRAAAQLLAPKGICVIRIPVIGHAWEEYGTNWVQLDPPRHFSLHTEKSLELLAQQSGLKVNSVEYDSNEFQFWGSELCRRGIPLKTNGVPHRFFTSSQFRAFRKKADELNIERHGDQAMFLLGLN
jgi:SAM-dependent methyltransferase